MNTWDVEERSADWDVVHIDEVLLAGGRAHMDLVLFKTYFRQTCVFES